MNQGTARADRLHVAMVGTRGVPARYGGFETAVEEIGSRLADKGHKVRVYCRSGNSDHALTRYKGMELVTLPALKRQAVETLSHSLLSSLHLGRNRTDVAIVFNAWNSFFLPLLRAARIPVATHVDGLEWKRAKGGPVARRAYRYAESAAVRRSDALIADARGIQDYYSSEFGVDSELLTYGAPVLTDVGSQKVVELGLTPGRYHLVVARFVPENHVHMIVDGYVRSRAQLPLVVVGGGRYEQPYAGRIREIAQGDRRVNLLGTVWDQQTLNELYFNAATYSHGHSVGGTNPSLLRAIGAGAPTLAYNVVFNREVLGELGLYFSSAQDLAEMFERAEREPQALANLGEQLRLRALDYSWDDIADGYESLLRRLVAGDVPGPQRSRRRPTGSWAEQSDLLRLERA